MKSSKLVRMVWAVGFLLPFGVAATPAPALACGSAMRMGGAEPVGERVSKAERALGESDPARAARLTVAAFPAVRGTTPGFSPLTDRALRTLALASVRLDGALPGFGTGPAERAQNLAFAVDTLRKLNAHRLDNPSFQSDLGEALAKVPKHQAEALKLLDGLAGKDLITSAEAYASLARLKAAAGDAAGREAAVKQCVAMTKVAKTCEVGVASSHGA